MACAGGALALCALGAPAVADDPTPIHLAEVYDITPGVSATHEVTLSTDHPLIGEQCQSMGTGAQASSAVLVDVNGIDGCRFTWVLPSAGSEVVTVDSGGVFHFHSESARLLEGFSTPEAVATIDSVTLVAHASEIVEASEGGAVTSAGVSTKTDASTVTWTNVRDDVTGGRVPRAFRFSHTVPVAITEPGTRRGFLALVPDPDPCDHRRRPRAGSRRRVHSVDSPVASGGGRRPIRLGCIRASVAARGRLGGEDGSSALHVPHAWVRAVGAHACAARTGGRFASRRPHGYAAHPGVQRALRSPDGRLIIRAMLGCSSRCGSNARRVLRRTPASRPGRLAGACRPARLGVRPTSQ